MKLLNFKELMDTCEAEALSDKLSPTEASVWRRICRAYSEKFHTPLHLVERMDPEYVIKHHFDAQLEDTDPDEMIEEYLDNIYSLKDPNHEKTKDQKLAEDIKKYEEAEALRIKEGRPIPKSGSRESTLKKLFSKQVVKKEAPPIPEGAPKEGFVNFGYLKDENEK